VEKLMMLKYVWQQFLRMVWAEIEQEIPAELAYCEFECRHAQCPTGSWVECPIHQRYRQQLKQQQEYNRSLAKVLERRV